MSKSKWKLNYLPKSVFQLAKNGSKLQLWDRSAVIPEFLIDYTVKIHTGKEFKSVKITKEKIGYKFGEFIATRKPYSYKGKKKVIKKK